MTKIPDIEPEIRDGSRGFYKAQELLTEARTPVNQYSGLRCSWHNTSIHPLRGSFALIRMGGAFDTEEGLIGEIVRITFGRRAVVAYVLGGADVPYDLSVSFRLYCALAVPAAEYCMTSVQVLR